MKKNEYGLNVAETCEYCKKPVSRCRETPYECEDCGRTACGLCCIDQWDGEPGFHCDKCREEKARKARGDWTPKELEEAGQLRLTGEERED